MRKIALIVLALIVIALLLWAPWLTRQSAEQRAIDRFNAIWDGVVDGCGFNCRGCGVVGSERTLLGYAVEIEYACGLIPEDIPAYHQLGRAFVSIIGTVTGLEAP